MQGARPSDVPDSSLTARAEHGMHASYAAQGAPAGTGGESGGLSQCCHTARFTGMPR